LNFCWRFFHAARTPIESRVHVNPRGVNSVLYTPERRNAEFRREILQETGLPADATILLYAGRISPEKNIVLLPKIAEILATDKTRDFRLLVAGAGPQADWLAKEAEKLAPSRVKMLGHLTDKEKLANLYANCDVFIHPNPKEPFGIAPLEAMASGAPVVAPDSGGILTYATQENTWLVENDAKTFAAAIQDIFVDKEKTKVKTEKALAVAREYTWEVSTDRLFALYDKLFAEFKANHELFAYQEKPKEIDFAEELFNKPERSALAG
jgi:glycosyltransferase involved in cell wall biosynthesis